MFINKMQQRDGQVVSNLAPTLLASPNMFKVPITFVFIVC